MKLDNNIKTVGVVSYYNYKVDIIQNDYDDSFEFWIYKKDEGIKMFCVGLIELDLSIIKNNIETWISNYNDMIYKLEGCYE